jgi:hypothetical protein
MPGAGDPELSGSPAVFHYHRGVAPMMWIFLGLATTELLVVHFLLALWRPWVAALVSALTLPTLIWLIATIASFRRLPVVLNGDCLLMRTGRLRNVSVPLASIAGFRTSWTGDDLKRAEVFNMALIAYPNIWIDLSAPVQGRRGPVRSVAHKLDDPAAFRSAVTERIDVL